MNGIYIHIPFCKKVCYYCDFHFTVSMKWKDRLIDSLISEIEIRKDYLDSTNIDTIYFGGGTPSILSFNEIGRIMEQVNRYYNIAADAEITFEANPDDLTPAYLKTLKTFGFNRLSIGVQSFMDADLKWMNRRHDALQAENCIHMSRDAGFTNLNIDLIYGLPLLSNDNWKHNLEKFIALNIPHLSAYHLTIEPKTVFGHFKKKGKFLEISEEDSLAHYATLLNLMRQEGYEHYEISNFCKDAKYSRHNTLYWKQGCYIGFGPSAHSFNGHSRQWNISVNNTYCDAIEKKMGYFEIEQLSAAEKFNDYLITGLRTIWGVDKNIIRGYFGTAFFDYFETMQQKFASSGYLQTKGNIVSLTDAGMFVSDKIISDLFMV